jgi:tetratricopeptide (TPR) repeat protein
MKIKVMNKIEKFIKILCVMICAYGVNIVYSAGDYNTELRKGFSAVKQSDYEKAKEIFEQLIKTSPSRAEAYTGMAVMYIHTGEYRSAKIYLLKSIQRDDTRKINYYLLGKVEEHLQNYEAALENYEKCLSLKPSEAVYKKILKRIKFLEEKTKK